MTRPSVREQLLRALLDGPKTDEELNQVAGGKAKDITIREDGTILKYRGVAEAMRRLRYLYNLDIVRHKNPTYHLTPADRTKVMEILNGTHPRTGHNHSGRNRDE